MESEKLFYPDDKITLTTEKRISSISTIQRALGVIEGVAIGLNNDAVGSMLYTAIEMIDEAVGAITDGK